MDLLMGVDVGTTRIKTLLFDLTGKIVGQAGVNARLSRPGPGLAEQDVEDVWQAVVDTARDAVAQVRPLAPDESIARGSHGAGRGARVLGLSFSTQTGTMAPVDAEGRALRPAFNWMDQRAAVVLDELRAVLDPAEVHRYGGWGLSGGSVLAHIAWLRRYEPAHYEAARYFLQLNDLIIHRMTGKPVLDPSIAGYSGLYNIVEGRWEPRALAAVGITEERLPKVLPAGAAVGTLRPDVARAMGLSEETWVMNGAHDQYVAALGAGVIAPGQVLLSCGTAWVVLVTTAAPEWREGASRLAVSRHSVPGLWGALRSLGGVGTSVEWYVDNVLAPLRGFQMGTRERAFEFMDRELPQVPIGARGLFCFTPAGGSSRAAGGRGALWGLTTSHTQADIGRALLEGIAFELRQAIEGMESETMPIDSLVMVGGASQSTCWPQIVADVTGRPVTVPRVQEAAARGAALLAGMGLKLFTAADGLRGQAGGDRVFEPQAEAVGAYDDLYARYRAAFAAFCSAAPADDGRA